MNWRLVSWVVLAGARIFEIIIQRDSICHSPTANLKSKTHYSMKQLADHSSMKMYKLWHFPTPVEFVGIFGEARLIRHLSGRYELRGGTPEDAADAREWCSHFAPEIVFAIPPRPSSTFGSKGDSASESAAGHICRHQLANFSGTPTEC